MPHRMILRLSKEEPVRLLSHLDMQTMLQRALRRCGLPVAYTKGFHPHAQISFPLALGLGFTSDGEYADIRLTRPADLHECRLRLSAALPEGFGVSALCVAQGGQKLSALMHASDYRITAESGEALIRGTRAFMSKASVTARKAGKGGEQDVDIRAMVYAWKPEGKGVTVRLRADALGALSPSLLMRAVWEEAGLPAQTPFRARRLDLVTETGRSLFEGVKGN